MPACQCYVCYILYEIEDNVFIDNNVPQPQGEEKPWLLFPVRAMSWGLRNPCFTKFSMAILCS